MVQYGTNNLGRVAEGESQHGHLDFFLAEIGIWYHELLVEFFEDTSCLSLDDIHRVLENIGH